MNWMKYLPIYFLISAMVIIPGVFSLIRFGFRPSIEFTGGSRFVIENASQSAEIVESQLASFSARLEHSDKTQYTFKARSVSEPELQSALSSLKKDNATIKLGSFESIGPVIGAETIRKTLNALLISSLLLLAYISYAFKQFKFGLCAVLAMFHDTIVLLGAFSLLGAIRGVEVDLLFVTAVLTILSFSVHDTIVVYDRIRELSHKHKNIEFETLVNKAVTETMTRSLNNSLTIIFMLLAMFMLGGESTRYFALALLIGTVTGTYSSTFTAAPLLVLYNRLFKK